MSHSCFTFRIYFWICSKLNYFLFIPPIVYVANHEAFTAEGYDVLLYLILTSHSALLYSDTVHYKMVLVAGHQSIPKPFDTSMQGAGLVTPRNIILACSRFCHHDAGL